jgi:hypothetical protein
MSLSFPLVGLRSLTQPTRSAIALFFIFLARAANLTKIKLVSLFIRAPDLGFLKTLCSKAQFFVFDPARKIRDTNEIKVS